MRPNFFSKYSKFNAESKNVLENAQKVFFFFQTTASELTVVSCPCY